MARTNPQEFAEKWARRSSAATQDFVTGVNRVRQAPGAQAAAKVNDYVAGVQANAQVWAQRVGSVSLQDWQQKTAELGASRMAQGVQAAQPKMAAIAGPLLNAVDSAAAAAKSMPGTTVDQRIQRAVRFMNEMHRFRTGR